MSRTYYFAAQDLETYMIRCFRKWGVPDEDATIAAAVLLSSDMRGVESHGIIRLFSYYGSRLAKGLINPLTPVTILRETAATLAIDAGNGLGHPVSVKTMRRCIDKARESGIAMATVRNSNHFGIAGFYAMMALPEEMIGICFTNTQPLVAPTHGRKALLGTNPIAVAAPALHQRPFVLDMATSIVPVGKISVYQKKGKTIPSSWGIDSEGNLTENPNRVLEGGALMPLGGPEILRGYKGYGLSLMVDIFSGVLAGSGFGADIAGGTTEKPARVGHFFGAIRIDAFRDILEFKQDMDSLITRIKGSPKAEGEDRIYIHGEKEFENMERAAVQGVPLSDATLSTILEGARTYGLEFDCKPVNVEESEEK